MQPRTEASQDATSHPATAAAAEVKRQDTARIAKRIIMCEGLFIVGTQHIFEGNRSRIDVLSVPHNVYATSHGLTN